GLVVGAAVCAFIIFALRLWGNRQRYTSADSAQTLTIAKQILEEFEAFCIILDETANPVYANLAAREYDGSSDLDRQLREPQMQQIVFRVLSTGEPHVEQPRDPAAPDAIRLRVFQLD